MDRVGVMWCAVNRKGSELILLVGSADYRNENPNLPLIQEPSAVLTD